MTTQAEPTAETPASLARNTLFVGVATVLSRVLGFAREVLLAAVLGTGPIADAFLIAFRIPNLVRRVLSDGGLNAGVVPLDHSLRKTEGEAAARRFAGEAIANTGLIVLIILLAIEIAAPLIITVLAPGFASQSEAATLFLRLSAPLIAGATLASLGAAFLASQNRFGLVALAPVVVNGLLVALLLNIERLTGVDQAASGRLLAVAVSIGGLVQLLIVLPPLYRSKNGPLIVRPRWSPAFKRLLMLSGPGLIVVASTQLAVLIALQVGSSIPGAVARLHYADRVAQLPLGFVASALGIVMLPELTRRAYAGSDVFSGAINRTCELTALFGLPAAVALALLAEPIMGTLFERGSFTRADTIATAQALAAMAVGLVFTVAARALSQAFFARERARPALLATLVGLIVTTLAASALSAKYGLSGLAWAISLGAMAEVAMLIAQLYRLAWWRPDARLWSRLMRTFAATGVMAGAIVLAQARFFPNLLDMPNGTKVLGLAVLCAGGLVVYLATVLISGALDWRELTAKAEHTTTPLA